MQCFFKCQSILDFLKENAQIIVRIFGRIQIKHLIKKNFIFFFPFSTIYLT